MHMQIVNMSSDNIHKISKMTKEYEPLHQNETKKIHLEEERSKVTIEEMVDRYDRKIRKYYEKIKF